MPFERLQDPEAIANWPQTLEPRRRADADAVAIGRSAARVFRTASPGFRSARPIASLPSTARTSSDGSLLQFTRECLDLRNAHPALRDGSMTVIDGRRPDARVRTRDGSARRCAACSTCRTGRSNLEPTGRAIVRTGDTRRRHARRLLGGGRGDRMTLFRLLAAFVLCFVAVPAAAQTIAQAVPTAQSVASVDLAVGHAQGRCDAQSAKGGSAMRSAARASRSSAKAASASCSPTRRKCCATSRSRDSRRAASTRPGSSRGASIGRSATATTS